MRNIATRMSADEIRAAAAWYESLGTQMPAPPVTTASAP